MKMRYGSYEFPIMPAFAPTMSFETVEDPDTGDLVASTRTETWDIEGAFKGDETSVVADWNALVAAISVPGLKSEVLNESSVVLMEIDPAECVTPPSVKILEVTQKREAFLVTNIRFRLRVEAVVAVGEINGYVSQQASFSLRYDNLGYLRATERGKVIAKEPLYAAPRPLIIAFSIRDFALESNLEYSSDRKTCNYTYTWTEFHRSLPEDMYDLIGDLSLDLSERSAPDFLYSESSLSGRVRLRKTNTANAPTGFGFSQGGNVLTFGVLPRGNILPLNKIDEIKDPDIRRALKWITGGLIGRTAQITSQEITVDLWQREINFSMSYITSFTGVVRFEYSVGIQERTKKIAEVPRYGRTPVMQHIGWSSSEISERGTFTTLKVRPPHPKPIYEVVCTSRSVDYPKPIYDKDHKTVFMPVSFSFSYRADEWTIRNLTRIVEARLQSIGWKYGFM